MKYLMFAILSVTAFFSYAETSVVNMAKENGIKSCVDSLKIASDFIIDGKPHGSHATWNKDNPNGRMYSTMTSKGYSDGDAHVTVAAAPAANGKCDTFYVETFALPKSCLLVREEIYSKWKFSGSLNDKTTVLKNDTGSVNVYLSPQGEKICLVSKREALYP